MTRSLRAFSLAAIWLVLASSAAQALEAPGSIRSASHPIPGSYIVVLRDVVAREVPGVAKGLARAQGASLRHTYTGALRGFSIKASERAARAIARDPRVAYVEQDGAVRLVASQTSPPWGLDRIDQRALPLAGRYDYTPTGLGVRAYILDTGIRTTHADFGGRASSGFDAIDGGTADDCQGHGTHVAGTVGGTTYGVAKAVSLVAVRVLDCNGSGSWSGVIAGVDWVRNNAIKPAVANMSLGGGASSSLDTAVKNAIASGVSFAIAAGNGDSSGKAMDACVTSPARVPEAVTVSATNSSDTKASWANYGTCVDVFAPGVSVKSAYHSSDTSTATMSGTSMAAPHVAGAIAQYLQGDPAASPATVTSALASSATTGVIVGAGTGSPNKLLYNGASGSAPPANVAPLADFTWVCSGATCTFTDRSSDTDGSVSAWRWAFGDGASSSAQHPSRTFAASGTYDVTLTVTDNAGATASTTKPVSVTVPSFQLWTRGYKVKGFQKVDLSWAGASGAVDVFRNNVKVATVSTSPWTHSTNVKGSGTYTYRVCNTGTTVCSNNSTVTF